MKNSTLILLFALIGAPVLASTERDAISVACTVGKALDETKLGPAERLKACNRWIALEPDGNRSAYKGRAQVFEQTGQFELAFADLSTAINIRKSAVALKNRGMVALRLNRLDAALADFSEAIDMYEAASGSALSGDNWYLLRGLVRFTMLEQAPRGPVAEMEDLKNVVADLSLFLEKTQERTWLNRKRALAQEAIAKANARLDVLQEAGD